MSNRELAQKLFETMNDYDPYEVRDREYTEDLALYDIENDAPAVIDGLLDIIIDLIA